MLSFLTCQLGIDLFASNNKGRRGVCVVKYDSFSNQSAIFHHLDETFYQVFSFVLVVFVLYNLYIVFLSVCQS